MTPKQGLRFLLVLTLLSSPGCSAIPRRDGVRELTEKHKAKPQPPEKLEESDFKKLERELLWYAD
jgi:hypothetical protein